MTSKSNNTDLLESGSTIIAKAPMVHTSGHVSISLGEKPKKFNGLNFKRWQQKMLFYLTTLNLTRFLIEDAPKLEEVERNI